MQSRLPTEEDIKTRSMYFNTYLPMKVEEANHKHGMEKEPLTYTRNMNPRKRNHTNISTFSVLKRSQNQR